MGGKVINVEDNEAAERADRKAFQKAAGGLYTSGFEKSELERLAHEHHFVLSTGQGRGHVGHIFLLILWSTANGMTTERGGQCDVSYEPSARRFLTKHRGAVANSLRDSAASIIEKRRCCLNKHRDAAVAVNLRRCFRIKNRDAAEAVRSRDDAAIVRRRFCSSKCRCRDAALLPQSLSRRDAAVAVSRRCCSSKSIDAAAAVSLA
ncbi:hypothetical protein DPMN_180815 [Dreissena polymorpha]|uniref:Uncharacterized protein n=1 Tax=Dreissena polymorpha TaxID=45954 RepID=A0A9D4I3Q5_DREPO|nr:hypothetical protein DPMN_180815 [Dreissena polymorpha]